MLSVIRELAEEAERRAAEPERGPLGDLLVELVRHGEEAVARTPEQLDVLREAGVVDAGGAGLVELLRGLAGAVTGEALPAAPAAEAPSGADSIHLEPSRYRYCTVFVVEGEALDRDELEARLEGLGDSLVVVGDETALKVHIHTDDPGSALSLGSADSTSFVALEPVPAAVSRPAGAGSIVRAPPPAKLPVARAAPTTRNSATIDIPIDRIIRWLRVMLLVAPLVRAASSRPLHPS